MTTKAATIKSSTQIAGIILSLAFSACGGTSDEPLSATVDPLSLDAPGADPTDGPPVRKPCVSSFGAALSSGSHGRLDGILVAIVPPGGHACSGDAHHVHLQIAMQGSTYDVAVNVAGVDFGQADSALIGGPWSEGWHSGAALDYPTSLGLHASDFTSVPEGDLSTQVANALAHANHVSVFATKYSKGGTHLVHRNGNGNDGAIIIDPLSARPHYLVFHFPNQSF
jgi:hypothetical protein